MQIDGHHTFTYIAARCAGYPHQEAALIAHAAQYVDDATNDGYIRFDNGALYYRVASAHKMLDYRNFDELANHHCWIPFHFLPGNGGEPAGSDPDGRFIRKLVCKPDSPVARDMLRACLDAADKPYFLHRIGISMHVYADTWSHQGFAGVRHAINDVSNVSSNEPGEDETLVEKMENFFIDKILPLGHGPALSHPDKPYLKWSYTNGLGEHVERDNPADFLQATDCLCRALGAIRGKDTSMRLERQPGLSDTDKAKMAALINTVRGDGDTRHQKWIQAIENGSFSFGPARLSYVAKGKGSWKYKAIGQDKDKDEDGDVFPYRRSFLGSDWKHFHDALQATRYAIVNEILPRYGICAA